MSGNEALAEAAIAAGCRCYFGYPITPQNEIPAYMSRRLPELGGVFIQAESELAAINMVYGASAAGARAMTSSSSPGISLKMEGISYLAGAELPAVIVNVSRGGPGLGNISASQGDYFQATKGGGHGDYHMLVLAPASVQETADLTKLAFYLADKYRNPVMILSDGLVGQMLEPVVISEQPPEQQEIAKPWALTGAKDRPANVIKSLLLAEGALEQHNLKLHRKYQQMILEEPRWEAVELEGARLVIVAFGIVSRIAKSAIRLARDKGMAVGMIRPITLYPFPDNIIARTAAAGAQFLVAEMNLGQMLEDVRLAVNGQSEVYFHGRAGGAVPSVEEIFEQIEMFYCKKEVPVLRRVL